MSHSRLDLLCANNESTTSTQLPTLPVCSHRQPHRASPHRHRAPCSPSTLHTIPHTKILHIKMLIPTTASSRCSLSPAGSFGFACHFAHVGGVQHSGQYANRCGRLALLPLPLSQFSLLCWVWIPSVGFGVLGFCLLSSTDLGYRAESF